MIKYSCKQNKGAIEMTNNSNFDKTMKAAERFYGNSMHNFAAKTLDNDGFTARLDFENKQYWAVSRIDKEAEIVILEISLSVICLPEARSQLSEYIQLINNKYKTCNFRISSNNSIYIHTEQRFDDAPLTPTMFRIMEAACVKILDTFYHPISKLANCKLITKEEADIDSLILSHDKKIKSKLHEIESDMDSLFERIKNRSSDDTDDEDDFSHMSLPEPPGFSEWLRKRSANGNPFASKLLAEKDDDSSTEDSDEHASDNLLDILLGLPEDATLEEIETSLAIPDETDDSTDE